MKKSKHNKIKKNKTLKITKSSKAKFINQILKEWKKQTNGTVVMDTQTQFKYDYYLLFSNYDDYDNHIHLLLKNFKCDHNTNNNIIYMMKKYDTTTSKIVHSNKHQISILSDPAKIVYNMIQNYNNFINT
jgi:hypothetical protein